MVKINQPIGLSMNSYGVITSSFMQKSMGPKFFMFKELMKRIKSSLSKIKMNLINGLLVRLANRLLIQT
jgi:hypothetical protein